MDFKRGDYIEYKMKESNIKKIKLYNELKSIFHNNDDEYVSYKGFASRFYTKFYAEDLFEISYLLGIDLNKMRDELINARKSSDTKLLEKAMRKSKCISSHSGNYSKWFSVEKDIVYIVWFKPNDTKTLDYLIEMYDLKKDEMTDIIFLTYKAIVEMNKDWEDKSFDEKLSTIKACNKQVYDQLYLK